MITGLGLPAQRYSERFCSWIVQTGIFVRSDARAVSAVSRYGRTGWGMWRVGSEISHSLNKWIPTLPEMGTVGFLKRWKQVCSGGPMWLHVGQSSIYLPGSTKREKVSFTLTLKSHESTINIQTPVFNDCWRSNCQPQIVFRCLTIS